MDAALKANIGTGWRGQKYLGVDMLRAPSVLKMITTAFDGEN